MALLDQAEPLVLLEALVQLDLLVRQVAMVALEPLGLLVQLDLRARQVARAAQERLGLLVRLDLLERKELLGQAEDRQEPLGLLAPLVLLLRLGQMAKYNTIMAALQWVELQDFTITTLQIE